MKKYAMDLPVVSVTYPREGYALLKLRLPDCVLAEASPMVPGQFVEVLVSGSPSTFLRRPISINYVDEAAGELWLLVHAVGDGTRAICGMQAGDVLNCMFPLGNGFTLPAVPGGKLLLVGGGVGTAPLLYLGKRVREAGCEPVFLLGGRTGGDLMQLDLFAEYGRVCITTEDGSLGEKGYVTNHSILSAETFGGIATCGPKPMMVAVARYAAAKGIPCELSLENMMACGLGACLCCVEKNHEGHNVCVCKDGPVFNLNELSWLD